MLSFLPYLSPNGFILHTFKAITIIRNNSWLFWFASVPSCVRILCSKSVLFGVNNLCCMWIWTSPKICFYWWYHTGIIFLFLKCVQHYFRKLWSIIISILWIASFWKVFLSEVPLRHVGGQTMVDHGHWPWLTMVWPPSDHGQTMVDHVCEMEPMVRPWSTLVMWSWSKLTVTWPWSDSNLTMIWL